MTADVALIGPYPPPYGGIGIHIKRLLPILEDAGIQAQLYNVTSEVDDGGQVRSVYAKRRRWLATLPWRVRERVVHFHAVEHPIHRSVAIPLARIFGRRVALSYHNGPPLDRLDRLPLGQRRLVVAQLRSARAVHVVNKHMVDLVGGLGVDRGRIWSYPAFLPPDPRSDDPLPRDVDVFLADHSPALVAIGDPNAHRDGVPIYGLDMLVDLLADLAPEYPDIGLVVFLHISSHPDDPSLREVQVRAEAAGVAHRLFLARHLGECWRAFTQADVYVRPTSTDGDAVAVREALWLGCPVVASDVGFRPEGVTLFPRRDADRFAGSVRGVLADLEATRTAVREARPIHPGEEVLSLYRALLDR